MGAQSLNHWATREVPQLAALLSTVTFRTPIRMFILFFGNYLFALLSLIIISHLASLVAQLVKNPPAVQETPVGFLGLEDPLEKGAATHSSILAWRIPWTV